MEFKFKSVLVVGPNGNPKEAPKTDAVAGELEGGSEKEKLASELDSEPELVGVWVPGLAVAQLGHFMESAPLLM